jgi:hypothetical protein
MRSWLAARWRLVAVCAVVGGIAGALVAARGLPRYAAPAIVIATDAQRAAAPQDFESLAAGILFTDVVLQGVIEDLRLDQTPSELRSGGRLETESVSSPLAVRIVGRGTDPQEAAALATTAAEHLAAEAEARGLGTFDVLPGSSGEQLSLVASGAIGAGAGALVALLTLVVVALVRRPITGLASARRVSSWDGGFVVRLRRGRGVRRRIYPHGVLDAITAASTSEGRSCALVLIERRRAGDPPLRWVAGALGSEIAGTGRHHDVPTFRILDGELEPLGDERPEALRAAGSVVTIVSEGARSNAVAAYDEAMLALGSPLQRRLLVMVTSARGRGVAAPPPRAALPADASRPEDLEPSPEADPAPEPAAQRERAQTASGEVELEAGLAEPAAAEGTEPPSGLDDPDPEVRKEALRSLISSPSPGAGASVRGLLRDPDPEVRGLAVSALAALAAPRSRT